MVVNNRFTVEKARAVIEAGKHCPHVRNSLVILEQTLDRYDGNEIFLSFNGDDPFPEVDAFVEQAKQYYNLKITRSKKQPIKLALTNLLNENRKLKASLMGIRKGDPGSEKLQHFQETDPGWPQLMRISPILDWSYRNVWDFLLEHQVPYCSLYDEGYTSLGEMTKTFPNPLLQLPNSSNYQPAYTLIDDATERNGRG